MKPNVFTERNKSQQNQYKNKYGLTIKNFKTAQSLQASARVSLAEKHNLPELGFLDQDSEVSTTDQEPFGWKIGLKDRDSKYAQELNKNKFDRNIQRLHNQKKQQQQLQRGIDKLTHNQFYR